MNWYPENLKLGGSSEDYMSLQDGENRFRILSLPIAGWEEWDVVAGVKKPVRYPIDKKPAAPIDPEQPPKQFLSCIVWDYATKKIRILTMKQATVLKPIQILCNDQDWGDPSRYDIKVNKSGSGKDTAYAVTPVAPKPLSDEIKQAFLSKPCCLFYLFENGDPFSCSREEATKGLFEEGCSLVKLFKEPISQEELDELNTVIGEDSDFKNKVLLYYKINGLSDLPKELFSTVIERAKNAKLLRK